MTVVSTAESRPDLQRSVISIEDTLVARARKGDMDAWARLYQDHFDGLFRHLRYLCGDSQAAEELTQETFVQALLNVRRFRGDAKFSTWLHGIGINVVRGHWRAEKSKAKAHDRLGKVHAVQGDADEAPEHDVLRRERVDALYVALETLPDHLRAAWILRELEELSPAEAALQLGISTNNFKVRVTRARTRLRRTVAQMGLAGEGAS